jgi:hypothetical protein
VVLKEMLVGMVEVMGHGPKLLVVEVVLVP